MLYYTVKRTEQGDLHEAACALLFGLIAQKYPQYSSAALCHKASGAPYLELGGEALGDIYISVSHSHGMCAAAISDSPVGIDVELVRTLKREDKLFERFFSSLPIPQEIEQTRHRFFYKWTYAEACYKVTQDYATPVPLHTHESVRCDDGRTYILCVVGR